jgi:hypothetical protein
MDFPISNLSQMSNEQILLAAHKSMAIPALLILFIAFIISFIFWGFALVKEDRKKLIWILILTALTSGIALLALIFIPLKFTQPIINFFFR